MSVMDGRIPRVLVAVLALAVASCGSASTGTRSASPAPPASEAPSPSTGGTATASPSAPAGSPSAAPASPSAAPASEVPGVVFTLTSPAFAPGAMIPKTYTCDGSDLSPALAWSGTPAGSTALVLLVDDPDANGFVHWIVLDIPGSSDGGLPQGVSSSTPTPRQGTNDFGRVGWGGPCPPSGTHRYTFTLYALAAPLGLPGNPRGAAVRTAFAGATVVARTVLQGLYRRGG
jgi:Raf kinase inhibitor-like YbhB/YbcL family protein